MLEHGDTPNNPGVDVLIERGGLTKAHWKKIVNETDKPDDNPDIRKRALPQTVAKIIAYADKVFAGEFPDSGLYHRDYLGRRHWRYLAETQTVEKIKPPPALFPPWPTNTRGFAWVMPDEVRAYASAEKRITYTLNDYFEKGFGDPFIWGDDGWTTFEKQPGRPELRTYKDGIVAGMLHSGFNIVGESDIEELLKSLLLSVDDINDPVHTSPKRIEERLIKLAHQNPEEIKARLMSRVGSANLNQIPHFGIVEKEI